MREEAGRLRGRAGITPRGILEGSAGRASRRASFRLPTLLGASLLAACAAARGASDEAELRAMHEQVLRSHRDGDLDAWLGLETDPYVVASRGEITLPTAAERRAARAPYLSRTTFSVYRDLCEPRVEISEDGSLGWLICQVEGRGVQRDEQGGERPIEFVYAWIELYRLVDGHWRLVGNVSCQRPPGG